MINYWWVTRPKRKLNSIPEVLAVYADISLNQEWAGQRGSHLSLEDALESAGLKRVGERRDHTGGGARTYKTWLESLGLIFQQESTKKIKLTLAGEAIMNGEPPVDIIKNQVLKYQFPSAFSVGRGIRLAERFKIRPFRFLLRLLNDKDIEYLTQEEIAKIIVTEADNETEAKYRYIVNRISEFRSKGNLCLEPMFLDTYSSNRGNMSFARLEDLANTIINWLEYTQLISREAGKITILDDKRAEVAKMLSVDHPLIDRPYEQEYFQRKYGLDFKHEKDTRNLINSDSITAQIIAEQKIKQAYIIESLREPITKVSTQLVDKIAKFTGINVEMVEATLIKFFPNGSIGAFMTKYFEMAFKGRDDAVEFEKATVSLFKDVFGLEAIHTGPIGLTPDVLVLSDSAGYIGIIDNKAYSKYSISNDHRNRMVHNYIPKYQNEKYPLAFFSYIAGGFAKNIGKQIESIHEETNVNGSAISVSNIIELVQKYPLAKYDHVKLRDIFSVNRQVLLKDI